MAKTVNPTTRTTVCRRVELPIHRPIDGTWEQLNAAVRDAFDLAAAAFNASLVACYAADIAAMAGCEPGKLPKIAWPNTYRIATDAVPGLPTGTVSALDKLARDRYRGKRSDGMPYRVAAMRGQGGIPQLSRGRIYPIRRQDWQPQSGIDPNGEMIVSLPLARHGRGKIERIRVALRRFGDRGMTRQAQIIRQVLAGELEAGELVLYRKGKHGALMAAFSVRMPIEDRGNLPVKVAQVRTGRAVFTAKVDGEDRIWRYCNDGFRRRHRAHAARLQRMREDYKHEPRLVRRGSRPGMASASEKHRRRSEAALHNASAWLVNWAKRHRVTELQYDDTDRSWGDWEWARLRQMVKDKCQAANILMRHVGKDIEDASGE